MEPNRVTTTAHTPSAGLPPDFYGKTFREENWQDARAQVDDKQFVGQRLRISSHGVLFYVTVTSIRSRTTGEMCVEMGSTKGTFSPDCPMLDLDLNNKTVLDLTQHSSHNAKEAEDDVSESLVWGRMSKLVQEWTFMPKESSFPVAFYGKPISLSSQSPGLTWSKDGANVIDCMVGQRVRMNTANTANGTSFRAIITRVDKEKDLVEVQMGSTNGQLSHQLTLLVLDVNDKTLEDLFKYSSYSTPEAREQVFTSRQLARTHSSFAGYDEPTPVKMSKSIREVTFLPKESSAATPSRKRNGNLYATHDPPSTSSSSGSSSSVPGANEIVGFGRHKFSTYHQAAEDSGYVQWACSVENPRDGLSKFVDYCNAAGKAPTAATKRLAPKSSKKSKKHKVV